MIQNIILTTCFMCWTLIKEGSCLVMAASDNCKKTECKIYTNWRRSQILQKGAKDLSDLCTEIHSIRQNQTLIQFEGAGLIKLHKILIIFIDTFKIKIIECENTNDWNYQ